MHSLDTLSPDAVRKIAAGAVENLRADLREEIRDEMRNVIRVALDQALTPIRRRQTEFEQSVERVLTDLRRELQRLQRFTGAGAGAMPPPTVASSSRGDTFATTAISTTPARQSLPASHVTPSMPAAAHAVAESPMTSAPEVGALVRETESSLVTSASPATAGFNVFTDGAAPTVLASSGTLAVPARNVPGPSAVAVVSRAVPPSPVVAMAPTAAPAAVVPDRSRAILDEDMPWELSGARRRRTVTWILGTLAVVGIGGLLITVLLSQLGFRI